MNLNQLLERYNNLPDAKIGKLITFEGGDGAGKSTQVQLLSEIFTKNNIANITTREPGGTKASEAIRNLLVNENDFDLQPESELMLNIASRVEHLTKVILPNLLDGKYVVCDRFIDSTYAYQGYGHGLDFKIIDYLHKVVLQGFNANLSIILNINVEDGINRTKKRSDSEDRYENMGGDFHHRVNDAFIKIANNNKDRCNIINSNDTIENIHKNIVHIINNKWDLGLNV